MLNMFWLFRCFNGDRDLLQKKPWKQLDACIFKISRLSVDVVKTKLLNSSTTVNMYAPFSLSKKKKKSSFSCHLIHHALNIKFLKLKPWPFPTHLICILLHQNAVTQSFNGRKLSNSVSLYFIGFISCTDSSLFDSQGNQCTWKEKR